MLTISVWPRRLKEFLLTHPLYKSPDFVVATQPTLATLGAFPREERLLEATNL